MARQKEDKELTETIETYFDSLKEADEKQKKRMSDGEITENQYKLWRMNKIATGNRYKALRDKLAKRMTRLLEEVDKVADYISEHRLTTSDIKRALKEETGLEFRADRK